MTLNIFKYTLKIWLTSVAAAPLLYVMIMLFKGGIGGQGLREAGSSVISLWAFYASLELFFSAATWLVFFITVMVLVRHIQNERKRIWAIFSAGILLTIITFRVSLLQDGFFNDNNIFIYMMLCNCFFIGCATWFYKLKLPWYMSPA